MQAEPGTGRAEEAARSEAALAGTVRTETTVVETGLVETGAAETARAESLIAAARTDSSLVDVIQVVEEIARVTKREVETGRVRLHKTVREVDEPVEVLLRQEELEVERVPVGRVVTEAPVPRQDGDTYVLPVLEEVLVVEKRLFLKEELHVRRKATERTAREVVRLRKEEVTVEDLSPSLPSASPTAAAQPRTEEEP